MLVVMFFIFIYIYMFVLYLLVKRMKALSSCNWKSINYLANKRNSYFLETGIFLDAQNHKASFGMISRAFSTKVVLYL